MSATTMHEFQPAERARAHGFFGRIMSRMIEARKRQADRLITDHLLLLDDATLASYGYDRAALKRSRGLRTPLA